MKSNGYIKLYRDLLQHPVFTDPYLLKLFNYCLLKASHKERDYVMDNTVVKLMPGEFIWGRKSATDDLNHKTPPKYKISESSWERKLKTLEKLGILTRKTNNKFTVINVVNWGFYQADDSQSEQQYEQQMNNKRTTDEQQMNTNKNVKNVEHVKNDKEKEKENEITLSDLEKIAGYYQHAIGPLMPNDYNELKQDCNQYGKAIVCKAIEESAKRGARDFNKPYTYVAKCLIDWNKRGLMTKEAVDQYLNKREQNYKSKPLHSPYVSADEAKPLTPEEIYNAWK